jgi:glycosyltransferase involved in cell wall biosynthesis
VRIVYVLRQFPKLSETFVLREVTELVRRGEDVTAWSLRPPRADEPVAGAEQALDVTRVVPAGACGVLALALATLATARRAPRRFLGALAFALRWSGRERDPRHLAALPFAAYLARTVAPEAHVHAHFANAPTTVALLLARLGGQSFSFTGHARDLFVVTSPALLRAKVAEAAFMVTVSEWAVHQLAPVLGPELREKLQVVPNGLKLVPREALLRTPEPGLVVSVGRLVPKKGIDTLVRACALVPEVRCAVVGDGPQRAELAALAEELGVSERVTLLGARSQPEVRDLLARASVFALPCRRDADGDVDNVPLSILEAMEQGVPVVATPTGGIPEIVEPGVGGILVAPDDPVALAAELRRMTGDEGLRRRLGAGARTAVERYDVSASVERLVELFGTTAS